MTDQNLEQVKPKNPLTNWYRQPKIYIKLPSNGDFYPPGALDKSSTGDSIKFWRKKDFLYQTSIRIKGF